MTAIHASADLHVASNGHHTDYAHDHLLLHNKNSNYVKTRTRSVPVAFAHDEFTHLTLYTGNTMRTGTTGRLNTTLKKSNQELVSAVEDTLVHSLDAALIDGPHITVADPTSVGPLDGDRSKYDITVKLFFLSPAGTSTPLSLDHLSVALQNLEAVLGSSPEVPLKIDHFILALPNQTFDENELDPSELESFNMDVKELYLPLWKKLSELRMLGKIGRLGVAEFSKQQLEILKSAAFETGAIGPEVDQVNLQDCCSLPRGLIEYAKAEGIELLAHGDSTNILPKSTLASLLQPHLPGTSESSLAPNFVLKYSALLTGRGLITRKGYIVDAVAA